LHEIDRTAGAGPYDLGYPPPHLDLSQSENVDRDTAVRLARRLIRDGSLPTPELAGAHFEGSVSPATTEDVSRALEAAEARQPEALSVGVARSRRAESK
jgi:hypothetical protein